VILVFTYGSERWTLKKCDERKMSMIVAFVVMFFCTIEMGWLRRILGVSRLQSLVWFDSFYVRVSTITAI